MDVTLVFPHQLFESNPAIAVNRPVYLVEEYLFFRQYAFHKRKIAYHRATMKRYQQFLEEQGLKVNYIDSQEEVSDIRKLIPVMKSKGFERFYIIDPVDNWLSKRINETAKNEDITVQQFASPMFLNTPEDLQAFFKTGQKRFFQTSFYIDQRRKHQVMIDLDGGPKGGKWSFDAENRKKYPTGKTPPHISFPENDSFHIEAINYVNNHFQNNPGALDHAPLYPTGFECARQWLQQFLETRFCGFGPFEDAIVGSELILHHSVLTPMLNTGIITPAEVIRAVLEFADRNEMPMQSTEGFIRQIMGWREFIRGVYEFAGSSQRTRNFWNFERKIPASFYAGTTGILPVDITIQKVLNTGYCHHIERLMVLGNFMLLCEFDPDEVYRWFMELFIDAYDWVMVPNVYGMSQFADGGMMATKPYISGSNYLMKMGDFPKGEWQTIWDALFWRFIDVHRSFFVKNPRLNMLVKSFDKMPADKRASYHTVAEKYLEDMDR